MFKEWKGRFIGSYDVSVGSHSLQVHSPCQSIHVLFLQFEIASAIIQLQTIPTLTDSAPKSKTGNESIIPSPGSTSS